MSVTPTPTAPLGGRTAAIGFGALGAALLLGATAAVVFRLGVRRLS